MYSHINIVFGQPFKPSNSSFTNYSVYLRSIATHMHKSMRTHTYTCTSGYIVNLVHLSGVKITVFVIHVWKMTYQK